MIHEYVIRNVNITNMHAINLIHLVLWSLFIELTNGQHKEIFTVLTEVNTKDVRIWLLCSMKPNNCLINVNINWPLNGYNN